MALRQQPFRKRRKPWNERGHTQELTFSCFHRLPLLNQDRTRQWLIESLERARDRWQFDLWAYVIMPEHVHLLLYPREEQYEIGSMLKAIKQPVARSAIRYLRECNSAWLDRLRVTRSGHTAYRFWQEGGGYDRNIFNERTAWSCVNYIHENPVRRGLVACPTDWMWSSARWYEQLDTVKIEMDDCPSPIRDARQH